MPTEVEFAELCDKTKILNKWVENYNEISGLNGRVFISKAPGFEGNSIFIPASGYFDCFEHYKPGSSGNIWSSSSLNPNMPCHAFYFSFNSYGTNPNSKCYRYNGFSVRAVQ